jgi:hypothetical protein
MQAEINGINREVTAEEYVVLFNAGMVTDSAPALKTAQTATPVAVFDNGMPANIKAINPMARKAIQDYAIANKLTFSTNVAMAKEMSKMRWPSFDGSIDLPFAARTIECIITRPNLNRRLDEIKAGY